MKLTKADKELIEVATNIATKNSHLYSEINVHVACALRTKSGKIFTGMNVRTAHSICAEQVAIGSAFACGEREFETIAAVRLDTQGKPYVVSPCGLCRYTFDQFGLDEMNVLISENDKKIHKIKAKELLPYLFKRN